MRDGRIDPGLGATWRRGALAAVLLGAAVCLAWPSAALPSGGDDGGHKRYTAVVTASPAAPEDDAPADAAAEVWAGAAPTLAVTITNAASRPQRLGSVNASLPAGVTPLPGTVTIASGQPGFAGTAALSGAQLQLRDLDLPPGASATVRVGVRASCTPAAAAYPLTVAVKQSNDFNGTGNDFVRTGAAPAVDLVGRCTLAFVAQPASAQRESDITRDAFLPFGATPAGAPVTVQVRDGSGTAPVAWWTTAVTLALSSNPGAATPHGTLSATPAGGLATFRDAGAPEPGPRIGVSASGYRFVASSAGLAGPSAPSAAFDIVDVGRRCTAGQVCPASSATTRSTASVQATATTTGDILRLSLGAVGTPAPVCAGYTPSTDILDFDLTTSTGVSTGGRRTIVMTLLRPFVTRAASTYDACFQSTLPFVTRSGAPAVASGGYFTGLLPDCPRYGSPTGPCEVRTERDCFGNIVMTLSAPAADPRARF